MVLVALSTATVLTLAQLDIETDKMLYEDNIAEESQSDESIYQNTIIGKPIFNDGKPFYLERDATGNLDFNNKKTVGVQNDIPINRKDVSVGSGRPGSHDINSIAPNIHDYLNLPVKYTSSKFVYPMISGSYANLKYQGHNKYQTSNHKNYTTTIATTAAPKYFTHITNPAKSSFPTTFQNPEPTRFVQPTTTTTTQSPTKISTTTKTTPKPTTTTTTVMATETTTMAPEKTTLKYSSTILQSFSTSFKNKYVDSSETRRKSTTAAAPTTTTQRIFTSRLSKTTRGPTRSTGNPIKFIDDSLDMVSIGETSPTTYRPTLSAEPTRLSLATSMPLAPSGFKRMPTEAPKRNQSQKITFEGQDPSIMSLSEIFNSISGNDDFSDEQNNIQFDASNSIPVEVTRPPVAPSPTAASNEHKTLQQQYMQNKQQHQFISLPVSSPTQNNVQQQFKYGQQQPTEKSPQISNPSKNVGFPIDEDYVEFENTQDQYVKFEVQKPNSNMVQFKQIPSMNNVVISPDQNSASFVLGSQQSVGNVGVGSSMGIGTSLFGESSYNKGPVKLGTVINESPPMRGSVSMSSVQSNNMKNVNMQPQIQTSIRFPSDLDHSFDNAPIVKGTIKMEVGAPNAPIALAQNQSPSSKNQLVFPNNEQLSPESMNAELSVGMPAPLPANPSRVIFDNVNDIYEKINDKNLKNDISSNELPTDLTPPNYRPAGNFNKINFQQNQQQRQQQQQQRPINRQPPTQYQMQRRPQSPGIPILPNILPQFRPNAKTSQGHSQFYKDVGAIRVPQGGNPNFRQYPVDQRLPVPNPKTGLPMNLNNNNHMPPNSNFRRLSTSPQQQQQHQQQQQPNRQFVSRIVNQQQQQQSFEQTIDNGNRRLYRIPQPQVQDRVYMKPPHSGFPFPPKRFLQEGVPETQQMQMQRPGNNQGPQNQQQGAQFPNNQGPQFLNQGQQYPNSQQLQMNQGPPQFQNIQKGQFPNNQQPPQFQNLNTAQYPDYELNKQLPALPQFIQKPIESNGDSNSTHLEPVITLQMLQGKKGSSSKLNLPAVPQDVSQDLQDSQDSQDQHNQHLNDGTGKVPSVYVVYPTSGHNNHNRPYPVEPVPQFSGLVDESSVVIANHGEPSIPVVGPSEYQNTPFSVVSHFEQEPLLMAKEKRKNSFPYHMERLPHQSHDQQQQQNFNQNYDYSQEGSIDHYNIGEELPSNAARVVNKRPPFQSADTPDAAISSKLTRVTDKPIAIAYTPTEPNHKYQTTTSNYYHHPHHTYGQQVQHELDNKYSVPNYGGPVISEILDDKQNDFDYYQQHLQQTLQQHQLNHGEDMEFPNKAHYDFQAPFHASVSLGAEQVTNPYEGWSVVTKGTDTNKIDRSDAHVTVSIEQRTKDEETSTKKFDPNQFQPEYLSGFMPIFNSNSDSSSSSSSAASNSESSEMPLSSIFSLSTQPITAPPTSAQLRSAVTEKQEIEAEEEDNVKETESNKSNETVETTTVTTTITSQPVEEKKKVQIDSLEAFFDSLTRDYEDSKEETSRSTNSDSESRSE